MLSLSSVSGSVTDRQDTMLEMAEQMSAAVLAGGMSRRMGTPKALLRLGKGTILEDKVAFLKKFFKEVFVVATEKGQFSGLGVEVVKDFIPGLGPLGGLQAALLASSNNRLFLTACDMPFVSLGLLRYVIHLPDHEKIILPVSSSGVETLFSVYPRACLKTIPKLIVRGDARMISLQYLHPVRYINRNEVRRFDPEERSFFNMNTQEDYIRAKKIWLERQAR